jgi:hypothetical protein
MADAALAELASRFIKTDSLPWVATGPGSKMKVIYTDPATGLLTGNARRAILSFAPKAATIRRRRRTAAPCWCSS